MPRYNDIETITFTDKNNNQFPIKDVRPISEQVKASEIDLTEKTLLDEVASRREVFGDFSEGESWRVFDLNIINLTENNYDLSKIKNLQIPK